MSVSAKLAIVGKKLTYVYDTGWECSIYYQNATRVQYRVVSGPAGGRCAYQDARYAEVAPDVFNVVWYEETGTIVSQVVNLAAGTVNAFVAFPRWLWENPSASHGRKQDKLDELLKMREEGSDAPRKLVYMTARIGSTEDLGENLANVF
jgi:phenolic acid decarboxylase